MMMMMNNMENIIVWYCLWVAIAFMFFAEKPMDFNSFVSKMLAWWCFPVIFLAFIIVGYFTKDNLRWIKTKWFKVSTFQAWDFLVNGFMDFTRLRYKYKHDKRRN